MAPLIPAVHPVVADIQEVAAAEAEVIPAVVAAEAVPVVAALADNTCNSRN